MKAHLAKALYVEAAHRNPAGGPRQQRLHGHSYQIELLAEGEVDPALGWVVDYADLKAVFHPLYRQLDHAYLNLLPGLEQDATLPALERWIMARLGAPPEWFAGVRVSILGDLEYRPVRLPEDSARQLPERIRFTFEAAQSLPQLPEGHPCRRVHGHSYIVEAGVAELDQLGPCLKTLYDELDHQFLNDVPGLSHATCERICQWIWRRMEQAGFQPTVIQVQETPSARCLIRGL